MTELEAYRLSANTLMEQRDEAQNAMRELRKHLRFSGSWIAPAQREMIFDWMEAHCSWLKATNED